MAEYEVVLRVHLYIHDPEPDQWDWPGLVDETDDHLQFKSQRLVCTYNENVEDGSRSEIVDREKSQADQIAWLTAELARVVPKSGMVQDLESPHSHWNREGGNT